MKIRLGDTVKVLYGKDAGKKGQVVKVLPKKEKVVVEGMNIYKRAIKGDGQQMQSQIVSINKPMPVAKVMLVCPNCDKTTRVGIEIDKSGRKRMCKKCGKRIDLDETKKEKATKKGEKVKLGLNKLKTSEKDEDLTKGKQVKEVDSVKVKQRSYRQVGDM